jgi:RNase H-fold protein (predicted Holliday junction resolvase)
MLMGFDPGRDKCGVAIVEPLHQAVVLHEVVTSGSVIERLQALMQAHPIERLILGDQTASKSWQQQLSAAFPGLAIVTVDERNSSLAARDRYWQMYPPQGLMRLTPKGMRQPPVPIDDIVAILLVERYLAKIPQ